MLKGTVFAGGIDWTKLAKCGPMLLLALLLLTGLGSATARADGAFYRSATAFANPQIPDQRALIHYENGVERLVIDTSFKGSGTNFAWVVPLPSVPKIEPVSAGFFPTLQFLFRPAIIHEVPQGFWAALLLGFAMFTVLRAERQKRPILGILIIWLLILIMAATLIPALGTVKGGAWPKGGFQVLQRDKVGVYDTVTLSSTNGATLLSWLATNGFVVPSNALPVMQEYAREGWIFVASKLHMETNSSEPLQAHPLSFTFKTDRPVYPLRLTGIDNSSCKIDLYVFGANQAVASRFKVEQTEQPRYEPGNKREFRNPSGFTIGHPNLISWVKQSPIATKLTAKLTSKDTKEDAYLEWVPYRHERPVLYSASGALTTVMNYASIPVVLLVLAVYSVASGKTSVTRTGLRKAGMTAAFIFTCCAISYLALPKAAVTVAQDHRSQEWSTFYPMESVLCDRIARRDRAATNQPDSTLAFDTAWLREQLKEGSAARKVLGSKWQASSFTGLPRREEDSPGNYVVRQESNDVVAVWYDIQGAEKEFFRLSEARAKPAHTRGSR